jgi:hypothetical protein
MMPGLFCFLQDSPGSHLALNLLGIFELDCVDPDSPAAFDISGDVVGVEALLG